MVPEKSHTAKYPKRENRKPPAHLAEAFGPALFSAPDIIRRISTTEEVPQTPPEKKNFTVGAHSNAKSAEKMPAQKLPGKTESLPKEPNVQLKPKTTKEPSKSIKTNQNENEAVPAKNENESRDDKNKKLTSSQNIGLDLGIVNKKANLEIQKLIEKHQSKPLYEDDQDYSDENVDENYYLDPTQMDQSLLEGFAQTASKSEDQLLQEAILLQEQFIDSSKGIVSIMNHS